MVEFSYTSALLLSLDENRVIVNISHGARDIGLKSGDTWMHDLYGKCTLFNNDYLVTSDPTE
ncbi:MAG: hypothetical protein WA981_04425 [Glaciecola sp.]